MHAPSPLPLRSLLYFFLVIATTHVTSGNTCVGNFTRNNQFGSDFFGISTTLDSKGRLVIGSFGISQVYIFNLNETNLWVSRTDFSVNYSNGNYFGIKVVSSAGLLFVGSGVPNGFSMMPANTLTIYNESSDTVITIINSPNASNFGWNLDYNLEHQTLFVSAKGSGVYMYYVSSNNISTSFPISDPTGYTKSPGFGEWVRTKDNVLAIGDHLYGANDGGVVHIYLRNPNGSWIYHNSITGNNFNDRLGECIDIGGIRNYIVVGGYGVPVRILNSTGVQISLISIPQGTWQDFGFRVAIYQDMILVTSIGVVFLYDFDGNSWSLLRNFSSSVRTYGGSALLTENLIVIGASGDAGMVFIYPRTYWDSMSTPTFKSPTTLNFEVYGIFDFRSGYTCSVNGWNSSVIYPLSSTILNCTIEGIQIFAPTSCQLTVTKISAQNSLYCCASSSYFMLVPPTPIPTTIPPTIPPTSTPTFYPTTQSPTLYPTTQSPTYYPPPTSYPPPRDPTCPLAATCYPQVWVFNSSFLIITDLYVNTTVLQVNGDLSLSRNSTLNIFGGGAYYINVTGCLYLEGNVVLNLTNYDKTNISDLNQKEFSIIYYNKSCTAPNVNVQVLTNECVSASTQKYPGKLSVLLNTTDCNSKFKWWAIVIGVGGVFILVVILIFVLMKVPVFRKSLMPYSWKGAADASAAQLELQEPR